MSRTFEHIEAEERYHRARYSHLMSGKLVQASITVEDYSVLIQTIVDLRVRIAQLEEKAGL